MHNILFIILISSILVCLPGCENNASEPHRVGILLFGDSRLPQTNGFLDGLKSLGYQENINTVFYIRNTKNDRNALVPFVNELTTLGVDVLIASGGLEADAMKQAVAHKNIPVVVTYVNAITDRKLVIDRRNPDWQITGVDNLNAELSGKRVELIHDLLPLARRILILYYEKIAPSRLGVKYATEVADKLGITIDARAVTSRNDIQRVMDSLKKEDVDAMLTVPTAPIDNALKTHILPIVNRLKIPLITHSRPLTEAGALASYGANFYDLGKQAARLADKILRGVNANKLPFETPKIYIYTLNKKTLNDLSLTLPDIAKYQVNEYINEPAYLD